MLQLAVPSVLLAWTTPDKALPTPPAEWNVWVPNLVLPILGILIVLFCLGSFLFPYGSKFGATPQVFRGYGLDLQISLRTVFLMIGVGLSLTGVGIYAFTSGREAAELRERLNAAQADAQQARRQAELAQHQSVLVNLDFPEGPKLKALNIAHLECRYLLNGAEKTAPVTHAVSGNAVSCAVYEVSPMDMISNLIMTDITTGKTLAEARDDFRPLAPIVHLYPIRE